MSGRHEENSRSLLTHRSPRNSTITSQRSYRALRRRARGWSWRSQSPLRSASWRTLSRMACCERSLKNQIRRPLSSRKTPDLTNVRWLMDQAKSNTQENSETREIFTPTRWQVMGSTYYVPPPRRRRMTLFQSVLLVIAVVLITYVIVRSLA